MHTYPHSLTPCADLDVVTVQNPFNFVSRDADFEGMSNGWDDGNAYTFKEIESERGLGFRA